jgi:hypothetical protein
MVGSLSTLLGFCLHPEHMGSRSLAQPWRRYTWTSSLPNASFLVVG